ncbi:Probable transposase, partial [Azotobacter beijerinckii]
MHAFRLQRSASLAYRRLLPGAEEGRYPQASARLTAIKKLPETAFLNEVSSVPLQQCLRHQQAAFKNFFEGRARY